MHNVNRVLMLTITSAVVVQVTGVIVHPDGYIISCALDKYAVQLSSDISAVHVACSYL